MFRLSIPLTSPRLKLPGRHSARVFGGVLNLRWKSVWLTVPEDSLCINAHFIFLLAWHSSSVSSNQMLSQYFWNLSYWRRHKYHWNSSDDNKTPLKHRGFLKGVDSFCPSNPSHLIQNQHFGTIYSCDKNKYGQTVYLGKYSAYNTENRPFKLHPCINFIIARRVGSCWSKWMTFSNGVQKYVKKYWGYP